MEKPSSRLFTMIAHTILILAISSNAVEGEKMLCFLGFGSPSHLDVVRPLVAKLAEMGHEITFLSPLKLHIEHPNITEYCPQALIDLTKQALDTHGDEPVILRHNDRHYAPFMSDFGNLIFETNYNLNAATLLSPTFIDWIKTSTFDLIILEHPGKEIGLALAHKFGAKVIAISPTTIFPSEADLFGWPSESSMIPQFGWDGPIHSYFPDYFIKEFHALMWNLRYKWSYLPKIDSLVSNVFKDVPPMEDLIQKSVNLYLVNIHFSNDLARSLPPFVVPIGGIHVKETNQPLSQNIEDFIGAEESEGFIYISFGSYLQVSALPKKLQKIFFDVIASFDNLRFLIKWRDEVPEDLPKNVFPMKWCPQQDILAHPKCLGFVTQGGLLSLQQAIYHGVPVVVIPVMVDQPVNAQVVVQQGIGIYLELADFTYEHFQESIRKILYEKTFSKQAKEVSRRFRDRPMSPLDTAVWWTEYVLRHNDSTHLKPLGMKQTWWQRRLLGFWAVVFGGVVLTSLLVGWVFLIVIQTFSNNSPQEKIKST